MKTQPTDRPHIHHDLINHKAAPSLIPHDSPALNPHILRERQPPPTALIRGYGPQQLDPRWSSGVLFIQRLEAGSRRVQRWTVVFLSRDLGRRGPTAVRLAVQGGQVQEAQGRSGGRWRR